MAPAPAPALLQEKPLSLLVVAGTAAGAGVLGAETGAMYGLGFAGAQ